MSSKFSGLFGDKPEEEPKPVHKAPKADLPEIRSIDSKPKPTKKPIVLVKTKTGKSSSADYCKAAAYIRKNTYEQVRIALLREGKNRAFSDLIEELLSGWVAKR